MKVAPQATPEVSPRDKQSSGLDQRASDPQLYAITNKAAQRRKRDEATNGAIEKVKTEAAQNHLPEEVDPAVEVFIKAKLLEWDKDRTGHFDRDEVLAAMDEYQVSLNNLKEVKWQIVKAVVGTLIVLGLGMIAASVAMALTRDVKVASDGSLQHGSRPVFTTQDIADTVLESVLRYDTTTNEWDITDNGLREVDTIAFQYDNETFYHFRLAEITRLDSGDDGETDKLEMLTVGGHRLRIWETVGALEVQWRGEAMWREVISPQSRRLQDEALEAEWPIDDSEWAEADEGTPERGLPMPPARRFLKGGGSGVGGSGSFGHGGASRMGSSRSHATSSSHRSGVVGGTYYGMYGPHHGGSGGSSSCRRTDCKEGQECKCTNAASSLHGSKLLAIPVLLVALLGN